MPLPKPRPKESRNDFISRCMADTTMVNEYSDSKQRFAICNSIYEGKELNMNNIKITENDFSEIEDKQENIIEYPDMIVFKVVDDKDINFDNLINLVISDRNGITANFDEKKRKIVSYSFSKSAGWDEVRAKEWLKENKNYNEIESFKFFKKDNEKRIVYGAVLVPYEVDLQGDIEEPEEIEKAAHKFLSGFQTIGNMHERFKGIGNLVESYIAPVDFMFNGIFVKKGSWIIGTKVVDDDVWNKIKSGELNGYSMGYRAIRKEEVV